MYQYNMQLRSSSRAFTPFLFFTFLLLGSMFSSLQSNGQASFVVKDPFQTYYEARQWFSREDYALSYPVFKEVDRLIALQPDDNRQIQRDEIAYYLTACELMQGNIAAERNAKAFLAGNNSAVYKGQMGFYLGTYFFKKEKYPEAAEAFASANPESLTKSQRYHLDFQYGYSLFTQKKFIEAKPLLNNVRREPEAPDYIAANYYFGLISYQEGRFKDALAGFEIAGEDPTYQPVAPYYSASIQYALGNKDKGLQLAEKALQNGNQVYEAELNQLIGHAYFEKGMYDKALPYLQRFVNAKNKVQRSDLYELAFCYYQKKDYAKAIEGFKPLSSGQDSLTQHAMYLLGDAYLKTNEKANAKTAFQFCASNSSNLSIRENSLFHWGKLALDLGLNDEATSTLKRFISEFPSSKFNGEAQDLLVTALTNTSNYKEALVLYESLKKRSAATENIFPRIIYNRAQEEINDKRYDAAETLLDRGIKAPYNGEVLPLLKFWKAEILFEKNRYSDVAQLMTDYLRSPIVAGEANPQNARYTLAYTYLMLEDYRAAQREWEALISQKFSTPLQQQDAKVRLADSYFMLKNFTKAKPLYSESVDTKNNFADYGLYQLGLIAGAENKPDQKISYLQSIDKQYPASVLAPVANLEIAKAYLSEENYRDALPWLAKIINSKAGESLKPEALLKQGLSYYNLNNSVEALRSFNTLLSKYGESPEADEAIDNVRSIFIEQGKPNDFIVFMNNAGRKLDGNVADSLTYVAAELQLSEGKKDQALKGFTDYLEKFSGGRYVLPATWYVADLQREKKNMAVAAGLYDKVIGMAPNKYVEGALLQNARYTYFEQKDYKKAYEYFRKLKEVASTKENRLEAMRGLVRCQYYGGDYAEAKIYATELMSETGVGSDDKIFASLVLGKNAQQAREYAEAIKYYETVTGLNKAAYGAEAGYGIAFCLYAQGQLESAEKAAFDLIKKSGSYAEWVTKSYLLLGDIFYKQKDYFNAKSTYKSVAENASIPALKNEASTKLAKVEKEESEQSKIGQ